MRSILKVAYILIKKAFFNQLNLRMFILQKINTTLIGLIMSITFYKQIT